MQLLEKERLAALLTVKELGQEREMLLHRVQELFPTPTILLPERMDPATGLPQPVWKDPWQEDRPLEISPTLARLLAKDSTPLP